MIAMKKIKFIISVLIVLLGISCSENFLELEPKSNPDVNSLYETDTDFKLAVNGIYSEVQEYYRTFWRFSELRADNGDHLWTGYETVQRVDQFRMLTTDDILSSAWVDMYNAVFRSNMVLEKLETADPELVSNLNRYKAEAMFLRALNYFNIVRVWGEVPLALNTLAPAEALELPQSDVNTIYEKIIEDLTFARQNLPVSYSGDNLGRATKGAAVAILGKVYLTLQEYQLAENVIAEAMGMGYSLLPDYNDVFDHFNEHHAEYIFDIEYEPDLGGEGSNFANEFIPNNPEFREHFGIIGDSRETMSPTDEFIGLFLPEDERLPISAAKGFMQGDGSFFTTNHSFTLKYIASVSSNFDSRVNWKVTRFADVILMYAEALNENDKTEQAITELNKIRTRADVPTYSGLSQTETRDAIAKERRLELAFEGHRWFDLLRTGKAFEVMSAKGYDMESYQTVFAKPQREIDVVNDPSILSQNSGY